MLKVKDSREIIPGKIIAVDFDGTIVEDKFPEIGSPNTPLIDWLKEYKLGGGKLILWTSRNGSDLTKAVKFCQEIGLVFDTVNENLPEIISLWGGDTRKVFADYYIDDKSVVWL